ncbi:MAG: DUF922 domain-containing protein [Hyphomicrobiaceae bacterium]
MRLKASFGALGALAIVSVSDAGFNHMFGLGPEAGTSRAPACTSNVELIETVRYYDFFGSQRAEADRSLRRRLLVSHDFAGRVKRFAGQADWNIEWRTCLEPFGAGCRVSGLVATVRVGYTLPRWADRASASDQIGSRWDSYATNLLAHERGHGRIALETAHLIQEGVVGLQDAQNCDAVSTEATNVVNEAMRRGEVMQNEYDRVTGHGRRQGAVFPF